MLLGQGANKAWLDIPDWEVMRSEDKGYGMLTVLNRTHASWAMHGSTDDSIVDQTIIVSQAERFLAAQKAAGSRF